ncbi:GcrA family cell cycle regulator [Brytella acorum]|uniref:GcrA cell cycle regulator n=1 Tax=Brytella acorum TaxID=2959299 RepID=A0AA35Y4C6_9PROT|nr:GcrA family cell cycle regulator [Brytella acorum]MDF3625730.1 GcrA family cell cycle regulator [Brytella acorum]CAI9121679.1 GcrA cell cycle regulator [Brytella acorum]
MEWTEEVISRLQELWQQGLSTAEIGRQLNITKNAVVGKAHRLGLPARPSPIRKAVQASEVDAGDVSASSVPVKKDRRRTSAVRAASAKEKSGGVPDPITPSAESADAAVIAEAPPSPAARIDVILTSQTKAPESVTPKPLTPAPAARISETPAPPVRPAVARVSPPAAPTKPKAVPSGRAEEDTEEQKPAITTAAAVKQTLRSVLGDPSPRRGPSCCWPIGDPGTPGFHFCGAKPLPGKPYCAEHAALAYVKLRDRRDSVA